MTPQNGKSGLWKKPLVSQLKLIRHLGLKNTILAGFSSIDFGPPLVLSEGVRNELRIAFHYHLFYVKQIPLFIEIIKENSELGDVFVTCSTPAMKSQIMNALGKTREAARVKVAENRGRNFGPMLVEFGHIFLGYDVLIHYHTKESRQKPKNYGIHWANICMLPLRKPWLLSTISLLEHNPQIGIIYGDTSRVTRGINYFWGRNALSLEKHFPIPKSDLDKQLLFPAGGMFAVRTSAIRGVLSHRWKYSDFPEEKGQLDGELHHGLERLIGYQVAKSSQLQVVLDSQTSKFRPVHGWKYIWQ